MIPISHTSDLVKVSKYEKISEVPLKKGWVEQPGFAYFHCFGLDYEEFDSGPGTFSTAIIEWPNGQIENVPAHSIKFVKEGHTPISPEDAQRAIAALNHILKNATTNLGEALIRRILEQHAGGPS